MAPWSPTAITIFGIEMLRCSESGGSSSSISPQIASKACLPMRPAIRPATMLKGRKRIFIAPGNVYPLLQRGTRETEMATPTAEPTDPTDLSGRDWKAVLRRTVREFQADNLTDRAAALTY